MTIVKRWSKSLALALLLLPLPAAAEPWCSGDGEHIWTFASGQAPYSYWCSDLSTGQAQTTAVSNWVQTKCQQAWDNFAHTYSPGGFTTQIYTAPDPITPGLLRWRYRCKGCVHGLLPLLEARPARLGPAEAGGIAGGVVSGQVVSIALVRADHEEDSIYLVDIETKSGLEQVEVNATDGSARRIDPDDRPAVCAAE